MFEPSKSGKISFAGNEEIVVISKASVSIIYKIPKMKHLE